MNYKNADKFNRNLKRNVYINKIKDVGTFINFINNIHKSIIGKNTLTECFYKFDRMLSVSLLKLSKNSFEFTIKIRSNKSIFQMYLEDLYSLLYLFFIGVTVKDVQIKKEDKVYTIKTTIEFDIKESHEILIKDILLRIKHIKRNRRLR